MIALARQLLAWWHGWLAKPVPQPPPLPVIVEPVVEAAIDPAKLWHLGADITTVIKQDFSFRETILDELDVHFKVLRRFKKADPCSFDLYSQVGAYLLPNTSCIDPSKVSPWFNEHRPGFGAVVMTRKKDHDEAHKDGWLHPRFFYFTKYKPQKAPVKVQRTNRGDVYVVTAYYDAVNGSGVRVPMDVPIALADDGSVHPLRMLMRDEKIIRAKHNNNDGRRGRKFSIPVKKWELPTYWTEDHPDWDQVKILIETFIMAANFYEVAALGGMTRVDVSKNDLHAAFSVDPKRTAYFFRDREKTTLPNGSSKRIFHSVRPHKRVLGGGSEKFIRFHFRGERDFDWNGYHVQISVPFRDHANPAEFDIGSIDHERWDGKGGVMEMHEVGAMLRAVATADKRKSA